jgi:hypothetical protein
MGILGRLFGYDSDYMKDAQIITASEAIELVLAYNKSRGHEVSLTSDLLDKSYVAMEPVRHQTLDFKSVDLSRIAYHSNSDEFPDCDDYARIDHAQLVQGAIRAGMPYAPARFIVSYIRRGGGHHAASLAIDNTKKLWLKEPQSGLWSGSLLDVDYFTGVRA